MREFVYQYNADILQKEKLNKSENIFFTEEKEPSRLLKTAMIFGANASGKSNLLRALFEIKIFICGEKSKVGDLIPIYDPFKFNTENERKPVEFSLIFIGKDNIKYKYEIAFDSKNIIKEELTYYPKGREKGLFLREEKNPEATIHEGKLGKDFNNEEIEVFHNQPLLSKFGEDIPKKILTDTYIYFKNINVINACSTRRIHTLRDEVSEKIKL